MDKARFAGLAEADANGRIEADLFHCSMNVGPTLMFQNGPGSFWGGPLGLESMFWGIGVMKIGGISFASSSWAAGASLADQDACFRGGACECLPSGCGKATSLEIVGVRHRLDGS